MDVEHDLAFARHRLADVTKLEAVGISVPISDDRFHLNHNLTV